jgi:hypothetical protein
VVGKKHKDGDTEIPVAKKARVERDLEEGEI